MKRNLTQLGKKIPTPLSPEKAVLETFPNPGVDSVLFITEECTSLCPVTGQPDFFTIEIEYIPIDVCIESKSLKLYLQSFRNQRAFMEELAVQIKDRLRMKLNPEYISVVIKSVPRGGLALHATATNQLPEM